MCKKCVLLMCSMALLGVVLTEAVQAQGPSLVGWWEFDDGAGTTAKDSSGKKHNGTLQGAPQWVAGRFDGALAFSGSNYVQISYAADLALNEFTVSAWVNLAAEPVESGVLGTRIGGENTFDFKVEATQIHGDIGSGSAWLNTAIDIAAGDTGTNGQGGDLQPGTWYMITYVIDNTKQQVRLYLDGDLKKTISISGTPLLMQSGESMQIGGTGYTGEGMNGLIDDVLIFKRALSAEQVAGLMDGTLPVFVKAEKPTPADGAVGVILPLFQWTPGETAVFEDVYLGATPELTAADLVKSHQSAMVKMYYHLAPPLVPGQTYYWRVDAVDATGKVVAVGNVWSFTTLALNASEPKPADGATGEFPGLTLTWLAGKDGTASHVYFGPDMAAVANGDADADKGQMAETSFNTPALRASTTYYWRVDTVKFDKSIVQGEVWSFATADAGPTGKIVYEVWSGIGGTAVSALTGNADYPKNPTTREYVNQFASPVDWADNYGQRFYGWLKPPETGDYTFWIAGDDEQQLWLSTDESPANGVMIANVAGWTPANDFDNTGGGVGGASQKSAPITLQAGQKYFIMALGKEGGGGDSTAVAWQGGPIATREIIKGQYVDAFSLPPLQAFGPSPANGAVDTVQTLTLTWNAGEKALQHEVYLGDDAAAVGDANTSSPLFKGREADTSFDAGALEWGKTYYWRVDEINAGEAGSPWRGGVWSFTTANYIPVDDFESYTDEVEGRIFQTWIDGWGYTEPAPGDPGNGTGATIGYIDPPFAEHAIVHGGKTSMPFGYNNADSPNYSETGRTFGSPQNWTDHGMNTLSLQVRGYPEVTSTAVTETGGKMTLTGGGADIWGTSDEFTYAFKSLNGDGSIVAKVTNVGTGANLWAKGGVMIRDSLDGGSAYAITALTGGDGNGACFQWRLTANVGAAWDGAGPAVAVAPPYWVKVERVGDSFTGYLSADGVSWQPQGTTQTITMTAPVYIGICVTSHVAGAQRTFQFEGIKTTGSVTGAWQGAVIDSPTYNSPQNLYVAIQDSTNKIAVVKDATAVNSAGWIEVKMPLSSFTGVSMSKVKKMFIGVGDRTNPVADGTGMLFIDDIRVIKPAP